MGSVLQTATLTADAVLSCLQVFESLERIMPEDRTIQVLPHDPMFVVEVRGGRAHTAQIRAILKELQLSWQRWLNK